MSNFHQVEVVARGSETQLQLGEKIFFIAKFSALTFKMMFSLLQKNKSHYDHNIGVDLSEIPTLTDYIHISAVE